MTPTIMILVGMLLMLTPLMNVPPVNRDMLRGVGTSLRAAFRTPEERPEPTIEALLDQIDEKTGPTPKA